MAPLGDEPVRLKVLPHVEPLPAEASDGGGAVGQSPDEVDESDFLVLRSGEIDRMATRLAEMLR